MNDQTKKRKIFLLFLLIALGVSVLFFLFLFLLLLWLYIEGERKNRNSSEYDVITLEKCASLGDDVCYKEKTKSMWIPGYNSDGFISPPLNQMDDENEEKVHIVYDSGQISLIGFIDKILNKKKGRKKKEGEEGEEGDNEYDDEDELLLVDYDCIVTCRSHEDYHESQTVCFDFQSEYAFIAFLKCKIMAKKWDACPEGWYSTESHIRKDLDNDSDDIVRDLKQW